MILRSVWTSFFISVVYPANNVADITLPVVTQNGTEVALNDTELPTINTTSPEICHLSGSTAYYCNCTLSGDIALIECHLNQKHENETKLDAFSGHFEGNQSISFDGSILPIVKSVKGHTKYTKVISMASCSISTLYQSVFEDLPELQKINLSNNHLIFLRYV